VKLTAKLAYSQIRINRSRTLWTLFGIVLSTALIAAVCSFAASGNALVLDMLGEGYGDSAGKLAALLLIPASIIISIIITMSVVVISNSFRVSAGIPAGSNILLNRYNYNDNGRTVFVEPFLLDGKTVRLIKADGMVSEIPVHGVLTEAPNELLGPNVQIVRLIVPQGIMRSYSWYASPADIDGFIDYANAVMGEMFPHAPASGYMELGFNTRVYTIQDYMRVMNIAIGLVMVFVYSFVTLLTLIGLSNVISTISANVRMRARVRGFAKRRYDLRRSAAYAEP
jgi:hypothetical protein